MGGSTARLLSGWAHRRGARDRAAVLIVTSLVLFGPLATGGSAARRSSPEPRCPVPGQITPHEAAWFSIRAPRFSAGPPSISDLAVEPLAPQRFYVTNGVTVMRTADGGCTWQESFSLAGDATPGGTTPDNAKILEVEVSAPGVIYLPIQQTQPVEKPFVVVSRDAGGTWADATGTPFNSMVGTIEDLDASLVDGASAAVLLNIESWELGDATFHLGQALLRTSDSGATWEPMVFRNSEQSINVAGAAIVGGGGTGFDEIAMNPVLAEDIWLYGMEGSVFRTASGGGLVDTQIRGASHISIALDQGMIAIYRSQKPEAEISFDGGQTFEEYPTGAPVESADALNVGVHAMAAGGRVLLQRAFPGSPGQLFDITPSDGRRISDIQMAATRGTLIPGVYGHTGSTIEVSLVPIPEPIEMQEVQAGLVPPSDLIGKEALLPASTRLVLRPGKAASVPYTLEYPAAATPTDVYFLIDISSSMGGAINGIRQGMQRIVDRLASSGIDVRFGVGAFRAYSDPPAYDRLRDIGPADQELASALNRLNARGGGAETQMAALLQSVTGEGDIQIPKDLNMHFRAGSLPIAIMVTDEPISQGGEHPSYIRVAEVLREHGVKQVAIALQPKPLLGDHNYQNPGEPASTLGAVADITGAIAPAGGVDCNGDGDPEIHESEPIVCIVDPARSSEASLMAEAITNVVRGVQDLNDLDVAVRPVTEAGAMSDIVESVEPSVFPGIDLKKDQRITFTVRVRCPQVDRKTTYPSIVQVSKPSGAIASAELTVICDPPKIPKEPPITLLSPFIPVAAVPPPPPRPPDPLPEPNPQPNPQTNPQAQAGFAAQEQQQPQVALAHQDVPVQPAMQNETASDEMFMSRHRERPVPPPLFVWVAGTLTSLAFVTLFRPSSRTAHNASRRRR